MSVPGCLCWGHSRGCPNVVCCITFDTCVRTFGSAPRPFDSSPGGNEKASRARLCVSVVCVMQKAEGSSWSHCDRTGVLFCSVIGGDKEPVTLPLWLVRSGDSTSLLTITLH